MDRSVLFVVDDDMTNLTVCRNTLSGAYDVFSFSSGALLLKRLERQVPDLILLDIDMPEMSGFEVIGLIRRIPAAQGVPVIFLTSKADDDSELEGLSLGASDYLFKPFSPRLLLKRIEMHLLVERQQRELRDFNARLQDMVDAKTRTVVGLQNAVLGTMSRLVECRDDVTGGHIERTLRYMDLLLRRGLGQGAFGPEAASWDLPLVVLSAQLHDVGKIAVRDSILLKPGRLTDEEFEEIKKHTTWGEAVIAGIQRDSADHKFLEYAKVFAGSHHEKWDGSGYPRGLAGAAIPVLGRAMALVDVYDALVTDRPYKKGFPHGQAVSIIAGGRGAHFDPDLAGLFLSLAEDFKPIAARVRGGGGP